MCGIASLLERNDPSAHASPSLVTNDSLNQEIETRLRQRGPDHFSAVDRVVSANKQWRLRLCAAVLHLRGDALTSQPRIDADGNVLCWNGEVFGYGNDDGGRYELEHGNDTQWLSELLETAAREGTTSVLNALHRVHGPWAMVWFDAASQRIVFGHDRFGRRSLLVHSDISETLVSLAESLTSASTTVSDLQTFVLSSVALTSDTTMEFVEVPANGLFVLDLKDELLTFYPHDRLIASPLEVPPVTVSDRYDCGLPRLVDSTQSTLDRAAVGLLTALSNAVGVRVRTIPHNSTANARVGVLFSGGLDSVVLAALTHFHVVDIDEPIDLLNVCFDRDSQFQSPDRRAAELSYRELCTLFPTRTWRFVCVNEDYEEVVACQPEIVKLLRPCDTHMDFNIGAAFWCLSRCHGSVAHIEITSSTNHVDLNAFLTPHTISSEQREGEVALAGLELFGAIDEYSVLCPANKCKRKRKPGCSLGICRFCCLKLQKLLGRLENPDVREVEKRASRLQLAAMVVPTENGEARVDDLVRAYKDHWTSEEPTLCRVHRMKQESNESTPTTATSTTPVRSTDTVSEPYTTTARVLLVGIGADEQLGGYGRHKTTYAQGGDDALQRELALDMARIWKRNLGRDDRCISAHGREARFPFLDEDVVQYIASLPLTSICDLAQPRGRGDKLVLRVAAAMLGLENCSRLAKRAIQFGSRIAKHANVAAFGSNRQASGDAKLSIMEDE